MAAASRRASLWLSLATSWICCACRVRSAAATCSRFDPSERLVGHHGQNHRSRGADAPRSDPPQRAAVELVFLGQQIAQHATGVIRLEVREMVWFLGQAPSALLEALPNHRQTLTGKAPPT